MEFGVNTTGIPFKYLRISYPDLLTVIIIKTTILNNQTLAAKQIFAAKYLGYFPFFRCLEPVISSTGTRSKTP